MKERAISFTTNPTVDAICHTIASTPPDWEKIGERYRERKKTPDSLTLLGELAEIWLGELLKEETKKNGETNLYPIPHQTDTEHYTFKKEYTNITVYSREKVSLVEYDALIVADSLPTIFESKINKPNRRKSNRRFNRQIRSDKQPQIFHPLQEYFQTDTFGYVVVTNPDRINEHSESQQEFQNNGGVIVSFNASFSEFEEEAQRLQLKLLGEKFNLRK